MSASPPDDASMGSFLDDYFSECDEHLTLIRRHILALEASLGKSPPDRSRVDELFRSFHTIKGLSGMVGLKEAEHLAHWIESYLGALREKKVSLSAEALDTLIAGINLLEKVIGSKRKNQPLPSSETMKEHLAALLPEEEQPSADHKPPPSPDLPSPERPAPEPEALIEAREKGAALWVFEFIPSPKLASRGVNVNLIRGRLEERGKILQAAPRVLPSGGVAFEFLVAAASPGEPPAAWREDGLTFHPRETHEAPAEPLPQTQAPGPPAQTTPRPAPAGIAPANIVRVDLSRLDEIMRLVGELVISRARLEDGLGRMEQESAPARLRPLQEANLAMERQLRGLREAVMRIRMVPVGEIFNRMQFVVRDVARENRKQVRLELAGQDTEIDKFIVERMMDPLLHLVRNAIGHGLETPSDRRTRGKPAEGRLILRAATAGDMVVLEVEDDGVGIDLERIAGRAREQGLLAEGKKIDGKGVLDILCASGFSTRTEADLTSGRGVGLTVVRDAILDLGGTLELDTRPGKGTRFIIRLPLTLAIADALIVTAGGQTFAIPQSPIHEVLEIAPESVTVMENNEIIPYRGGVLRLVRLARFFNLKEKKGRALYGLVVGTGLSGVALIVEKIAGRREIVVRAMTDPLLQVPGIAGATELGDGRVVLILDTARLKEVRLNGRLKAFRLKAEGSQAERQAEGV